MSVLTPFQASLLDHVKLIQQQCDVLRTELQTICTREETQIREKMEQERQYGSRDERSLHERMQPYSKQRSDQINQINQRFHSLIQRIEELIPIATHPSREQQKAIFLELGVRNPCLPFLIADQTKLPQVLVELIANFVGSDDQPSMEGLPLLDKLNILIPQKQKTVIDQLAYQMLLANLKDKV